MLGYGQKYLEAAGNLVLIYPKSDNFDKPFEYSFNYDDESKLKLLVVPFDVNANRNDNYGERVDLACLGIS